MKDRRPRTRTLILNDLTPHEHARCLEAAGMLRAMVQRTRDLMVQLGKDHEAKLDRARLARAKAALAGDVDMCAKIDAYTEGLAARWEKLKGATFLDALEKESANLDSILENAAAVDRLSIGFLGWKPPDR